VEFFPDVANISLTDAQLNADGVIDVLVSLEQAELHAGDGGVVINTQTYTGATILFGGAGDGHLLADSSNDQLYGFAGHDTLDAGDGNDFLLGASGRDSLLGGPGDDVLRGQGFSGDRLIGGPGIDLMDGGAGADIIIRDADDVVIPDSRDIIIAERNAAFAVSDDWIDGV